MDRAEKRLLRERLRNLSREQKRQFLREFLTAVIGIWGVRVTPDELTWSRFWGPRGCLWTIVWLMIIAAGIVSTAAGSTVSNYFAPVFLIAACAWFGLRCLRGFSQHLRMRLDGHVAQASVVDYHVDNDCGVDRQTPIVAFTTKAGERRSALLDYEPLPPLVARMSKPYWIRFEPGDGSWRDQPPPPPIGTTVTIAYGSGDPTHVSRTALWREALALLFGVTALAIAALGAIGFWRWVAG
jgi:hypothetical protein